MVSIFLLEWVFLIALFTALFTMPRWCCRSVARHRMWAARSDHGRDPGRPAARRTPSRPATDASCKAFYRRCPPEHAASRPADRPRYRQTDAGHTSTIEAIDGATPCDRTDLSQARPRRDRPVKQRDRHVACGDDHYGIVARSCDRADVVLLDVVKRIKPSISGTTDALVGSTRGRRLQEQVRLEELHVVTRTHADDAYPQPVRVS